MRDMTIYWVELKNCLVEKQYLFGNAPTDKDGKSIAIKYIFNNNYD